LIFCYGISVSISKLPYSGSRLLLDFFMALQFLKAQQVQVILWLWQVAVIQAKTILLEDWRFTPTIALALDQSGVFPVEV